MHVCKYQSGPTTIVSYQSCCHMFIAGHSDIFNSVRSVKTMNAKNTKKKSPVYENADANITCDFGDGDISRFRSRLPHGHIVCSIIVRCAD